VAGLLAACDRSSASPSGSAESAAPSTPTPAASPTPSPDPTPSPETSSAAPGEVAIEFEVVVNQLAQPLDIAVPLDDGVRYVVEQAGRIRVVRDEELVEQALLDIRDRIASGGERGLLGLAFHPSFPDDPRLFVNYTDTNGDTAISEFQVAASLETADPDSERILIHADQPYANHNGGALAFGPDGMLYIALGDGGAGGDPHGYGQRLDTFLAKILRIDVDAAPTGDRAYAVPDDNPFVDTSEARREIWATGLRNPWRMRFDAGTGDLWIGDVGQSAREEIDLAPAGVGGLNFGWNRMEGSACFEPREGCDEDGLTPPVAEYGHDGGCAVIGGVVVRDPDQPLLDGRYVFSDSCSGNVWLLDAAAGAQGPVEAALVASTGRSISSIAADADGSVLATDLRSGELLRIVAAPR
jgi:glucose/arabinose dehydrogenase